MTAPGGGFAPEPPDAVPPGAVPPPEGPPRPGGVRARAADVARRLRVRARTLPLSVKLVASVLALVFAGMVVTSSGGVFALRSQLLSDVDEELRQTTERLTEAPLIDFDDNDDVLPSDYVVTVTDRRGVVERADTGQQVVLWTTSLGLTDAQLPRLPDSPQQVAAHLNDPYTTRALADSLRWRVLVTPLQDRRVLMVARHLRGVDRAVSRLVWIDVLVGTGVLIMLGSLGAGLVRTSLRPLVQIEQTAGAIAAGDFSRRVPEPEPRAAQPGTELGRLSRALNVMLAQIEAAFTAREASARAARSAEASAHAAAAEAQRQEGRARRSEERMRRFVADASHELRTPLTTIRGFAELYRQAAAADPAEGARLVRRIEDEAARMGLLVEDLLLLARLDRQRPLAQEPVELAVLASEAVQAARVTAPERRVTLELPPGSARLRVRGDDARLRQVLGNLVTNALTHTPAAAPVTVRLRDGGDGYAVLEVADGGPGLTPEQADRVFERFYRVDAARSRHSGEATGTGLGLAIVAAIVAAHAGTVEVDSAPGAGATFRVRLPLDAAPAVE